MPSSSGPDFSIYWDRWTKGSYEKKMRARANRTKPAASSTLMEKVRNVLEGKGRKCNAGCGKPGEFFRNGKMYCRGCVGRSSGWARSGMPEDRTPPMPRSRHRDLRRQTKQIKRGDIDDD